MPSAKVYLQAERETLGITENRGRGCNGLFCYLDIAPPQARPGGAGTCAFG